MKARHAKLRTDDVAGVHLPQAPCPGHGNGIVPRAEHKQCVPDGPDGGLERGAPPFLGERRGIVLVVHEQVKPEECAGMGSTVR